MGDRLFTGAETVAALVAAAGLRSAFAYPGTSELELCRQLDAAGIRLHNSRGDAEAVFMAAGANRVAQGTSCAVLHGARGLTNALGAVADVRRSEVSVLCIVGLASTRSARFLPPHAEWDLLDAGGRFAGGSSECQPPPDWDKNPSGYAKYFVRLVSNAIGSLNALPRGPILAGIPQDVAETEFVDPALLTTCYVGTPLDDVDVAGVEAAADAILGAERPVALIDDYALTFDPAMPAALAELGERLRLPILQLAYRRGAMLFQQLAPGGSEWFRGRLTSDDADSLALLAGADLLVTVEDRNMYPRVCGPLPRIPKVAITSNRRMAVKNEYLDPDDRVLVGSPLTLVRAVVAAAASMGEPPARRTPPRSEARSEPHELVDAVARALARSGARVLVDDSQMFGGVFARDFGCLPPDLRVFGSHGGFVGSGLATAVGAASASQERTFCFLGDQGLTNAIQALVVAGSLRPNLTIVVCNNGRSVSLTQQAAHDGLTGLEAFLENAASFSYADAARAFGVPAMTVAWDEGLRHAAAVEKALVDAGASGGPFLVELVISPASALWSGVWATAGLDAAPVA
jgi:acetolactate synthase-1/2/3 large subunit